MMARPFWGPSSAFNKQAPLPLIFGCLPTKVIFSLQTTLHMPYRIQWVLLAGLACMCSISTAMDTTMRDKNKDFLLNSCYNKRQGIWNLLKYSANQKLAAQPWTINCISGSQIWYTEQECLHATDILQMYDGATQYYKSPFLILSLDSSHVQCEIRWLSMLKFCLFTWVSIFLFLAEPCNYLSVFRYVHWHNRCVIQQELQGIRGKKII